MENNVYFFLMLQEINKIAFLKVLGLVYYKHHNVNIGCFFLIMAFHFITFFVCKYTFLCFVEMDESFFENFNIVVQPLSHVRLFAIPWTAAQQASLSLTVSQSLLKLMSIKPVMPSNHLILCCPLLLLPSIFLSIRDFSNELALCIRWSKYWSFSFSISPSNGNSRLISFRFGWLDLLAVQQTLKSLLQHHSSKASILQHSVFFMLQLSHPYTTTSKTIALTIWTFVSKVMSLLFNMLCFS